MTQSERYAALDQYIDRLVAESTPDRSIWNVEKIRQGAPGSWNYVDGCMMTALYSLWQITGEDKYLQFVASFVGAFVEADGTIRTFRPEAHTLDDINEGRVLFDLYRLTGEEKYRLAANRLHDALEQQPRTVEGAWWHKQIYPDQVWLDGIYMAQPFSALWQKHLGTGDYGDVLRHLRVVRSRMRDEKTGLYYHGYDVSRAAFWADKASGCSQSFWLRAIGWYAVALADLADILPQGEAHREAAKLLLELMEAVLPFADPQTGMYWQVVDQAGREGNYLETSGSSMLAYAMLKGARLGVLPPMFALQGRKTFEGIMDRYLSFHEGEIQLGGICLVAGLGPQNNPRRDGTYAYYISEPVVQNDAKGVAPFVMCYTEIKRLPSTL